MCPFAFSCARRGTACSGWVRIGGGGYAATSACERRVRYDGGRVDDVMKDGASSSEGSAMLLASPRGESVQSFSTIWSARRRWTPADVSETDGVLPYEERTDVRRECVTAGNGAGTMGCGMDSSCWSSPVIAIDASFLGTSALSASERLRCARGACMMGWQRACTSSAVTTLSRSSVE